ncbi:MAG TPA: metallophosphoesterase [Gemmatimonas sp.]|nr:metallophosphoesterase [Gemmatimonas sp.]
MRGPRPADAGVRLLHISDIHFGRSYVEAHVAAAEALAAETAASETPFDAIIVSGDLSQRARAPEFLAARGLLGRLENVAPVLVVPGNHDAQWWRAPLGLGGAARVHAEWRRVIARELEPTLRLPGVSIVGLNSAGGVMPWTLTWNPRDLRVKGGLTNEQLVDAAARIDATPDGDLRVLVLHHNVVRGKLSNRWGLARPEVALARIGAMGVDVVCTGHDHEERAEVVSTRSGPLLVSTANTLSNRARGKRVASLNIIEASKAEVAVRVWHFDSEQGSFAMQHETVVARERRFAS